MIFHSDAFMAHDFQIEFRNIPITNTAKTAFEAVDEQHRKKDGDLGAVFCQLREQRTLFGGSDGRVHLSGSYLPPKWAARINRVLEAYREEEDDE